MHINHALYFLLKCGLLIVFFNSCTQSFIPPSQIKSNIDCLVVDGTIISGQDSTIINLSRTQNLNDSIYKFPPETGAQVSVLGENGDIYALTEQNSGKYVIAALDLNNNEKYQLKIITTNGKVYLSDAAPVKQTPPIDSVTWSFDKNGVTIYVNTHDPQDDTRYYRWDCIETWKYESAYQSSIEIDTNGYLVARPPAHDIYHCWRTLPLSEITIASSEKLSNDIIYHDPVLTIPVGSQKLSIEYSLLVRQFAITKDAFAYWRNQKLNTEQLGTVFGPQPFQLTGNVHCTTNPSEPVLGFISACIEQKQRIFISNESLPYWNYYAQAGCFLDTARNAGDLGANMPVYQVLAGILISSPECVDCRVQGGTTVKPSFWP